MASRGWRSQTGKLSPRSIIAAAHNDHRTHVARSHARVLHDYLVHARYAVIIAHRSRDATLASCARSARATLLVSPPRPRRALLRGPYAYLRHAESCQ
jgi:hypothetical protein